MCVRRAKVKISGGENIGIRYQEYYFPGEPKDAFLKATNFAQGYAFACCEGKYKMDLQTPNVPTIDGFMWWLRGSGFKIEVLNMKDEPVKTEEDVV